MDCFLLECGVESSPSPVKTGKSNVLLQSVVWCNFFDFFVFFPWSLVFGLSCMSVSTLVLHWWRVSYINPFQTTVSFLYPLKQVKDLNSNLVTKKMSFWILKVFYIYPYHAYVPFRFPLKISENQRLSWGFKKVKKRNIGFTLHKNWTFPLSISAAIVTKSAISSGFGHIYWRNLYWKTSFLVQCEIG